MPPKTYKYRVKPGLKHNQGTPEEIGEGEIVELTLEQADSFLDKLEPLESEAQNPPAVEDAQKPEPKDMVDRAGLGKMTVKELKELPEWVLVPDPKPVLKAHIINAIVELRTP